jgi:hypothetical protein
MTEIPDVAKLENGQWIILTKNSLYWKARIDTVEGSQNLKLVICYGKSLGMLDRSEPSQVYEHEERSKTLSHLTKLLKDKVKNGYSQFIGEIEEKENKHLKEYKEAKEFKRNKPSLKSADKSDSWAPLHVEHYCKHMPSILTGNPDDESEKEAKNKSSSEDEDEASDKEDSQDESEDKKQPEASQDQLLGKRQPQHLPLMSIHEILDKKQSPQNPHRIHSSRKQVDPISPKISNHNSGSKPASSTKQVKMNQEPISQDIYFDPFIDTHLLHKKTFQSTRPRSKRLDDDNDAEHHELVEVNRLFKKLILGSVLYKVEHNDKVFTQQVIIQSKDEYLYIEYSVIEDMSINQVQLHQFPSTQHALQAVEIYARYCNDCGYAEKEALVPMVTSGTISILKTRPKTSYVHETDGGVTLIEVEEKKVESRTSTNKKGGSNTKPTDAEEKEEEEEEPVVVGTNLDYDVLSHSAYDAQIEVQKTQANINQQLTAAEVKARTEEMHSYKPNAKSFSGINPLGSPAESMISLQLLHNFKPTIEINSKQRGNCRLDVVRETRWCQMCMDWKTAVYERRSSTISSWLLYKAFSK